MARCPTCRTTFERGEQFCPLDGSPLAASEAPAPDDVLVGRVLGGRYRLSARLGQGGMGTVYRAVHTLMDKPVAVKILRGELATDAEAVARFHREARSASRLDHDHCIRVTDFGQSDDGLLYLAMELLEGRSLGQRLRDERLSVGEAASVCHAVAMALDHAHEAGVIHRDLKPDNVFLARRPRGREIVKVLDFGLAKLASDSGKSHSITRDGTVFGTPEYMAPEQAQGDPLDVRTDIYALGVLLYRMTTGTVPFRGDTFVQTLTKQVRDQPKPPRELDASIPPAFEAIILRCLEKRPAARFPTAAALADALLPFVTRADATGPLPPPVEATGPSSASPVGPSTRDLRPTHPESMVFDSAALVVPRRAPGAIVAGVVLLLVASVVLAAMRLRKTATPFVPTAEQALLDIERLSQEGKLDEAATQLERAHRDGESAPLERATSRVAERRGHRLEALAHMHRARTLAPNDPKTRVALAELLLRLGDEASACRQAKKAAALAGGDADTLASTRSILARASCASLP